MQCVKYARTLVFSDLYFPLYARNLRLYMGKNGQREPVFRHIKDSDIPIFIKNIAT